MNVVGVGGANSIDEVLDRMDAIDAALPRDDGVAMFNRMYREVTRYVDAAVDANEFAAGDFLVRLDVHFANLFFAAHDADLAGQPVARAWAPLFDNRARPETLPIQFAFAGMNAHISHDLPFAVVETCLESGVEPLDDSAEHADFTRTNQVLDDAADEIKTWFLTGPLARVDQLGGRVDDAFAMLALAQSRAAAWQSGEMLWGLREHTRMEQLFREGLARTVELANRGILL